VTWLVILFDCLALASNFRSSLVKTTALVEVGQPSQFPAALVVCSFLLQHSLV
jgi:hypothetical protein